MDAFASASHCVQPGVIGFVPNNFWVVGNHTVKNESYMLSCAIDRFVVIAGCNTKREQCLGRREPTSKEPERTAPPFVFRCMLGEFDA